MKKISISIALICLTGIVFGQGSLTPPGAPAPTMKTLDQVEARTPIGSLPYVITTSGSYYVTKNLTGTSGHSGITINADDVTVDLNGFALTGVAGSFNGITSAKQRTVVRNGNIGQWGGQGMELSVANNVLVENVAVYSNAAYGIVASEYATITGCKAYGNTYAGCSVDDGSRVSKGIFYENQTDGIEIKSSCQVSDSICRNNGDDGISGIDVNSITDCTVVSNTYGVYLNGNDNVIKQSSVVGNNHFGISALANTRVNDCLVSGNTGSGMTLGSRSVVDRCTVSKNATHGIFVNSDSRIMNNTCIGNGAAGNGAGIYAVSGNKIESNILLGADIGIQLLGLNNTIAGNTVRGNTDNYNIVATTGNQLNILLCEVPETLDWTCSVKLAGTLVCTSNDASGITVAANDVTIDMDGHALIGPGTSSGAGIHQSVIYRNLCVLNGKVTGWQGTIGNRGGIRTWGELTVLTGLQVSSNHIGIITGDNSTISDCSVNDNNSIGIRTASGGTISSCTVNNNGSTGIKTENSGTISSCTVNDNHEGIIAWDQCRISDCIVDSNDDIGITISNSCTIFECTVNNNISDGIKGSWNNTVSKSIANNNSGNGIVSSSGSFVSDCSATGNSMNGIELDNFCHLSKCLANGNSFTGIKVGAECTVSDCVVDYNTENGIYALRRSWVKNCSALYNTRRGILLLDHSGRCDGNYVTMNGIGIQAGGSNNFIVRNTALYNGTNYVISAGNQVGSVVLAPDSSAISGNTGGAGVGSTDPWANIASDY